MVVHESLVQCSRYWINQKNQLFFKKKVLINTSFYSIWEGRVDKREECKEDK